ncbi:hypothetical protein Tco_0843986, partial [Tanacetum coccineum]
VAFDLLRDALSAIFGLSELKEISKHKVPRIHCIDVIDEILEEDFDALLDKGKNSKSEFDEELTFEKITFDTDYKIKKSLEEPPTDLELKPLPDHLEYAFLEEPSFLSVIISS